MAPHNDQTTRACRGWGEDCEQTITSDTADLCPDCHMSRLDAQSPRIPR